MDSATTTTATAAYTVGQADLVRDRDLIIDLWSRNLLSHTPEQHRARFDWHYRDNPTPGRRCFLAYHSATKKVIGTSGLGVRRMFSGDSEIVAGIAIDFAVDPDHRTVQPAMLWPKPSARASSSSIPCQMSELSRSFAE
jgi:hypothetical protein